MVFADKEKNEFWQVPVFWLPEDTVRDRSNLASYRLWANGGWIRTFSGKSIQQELLVEDILHILKAYQVTELVYDKWNAKPTIQYLENHGVNCLEFGQGKSMFTGPSKHYERLVNTGKLHHNGHPVLEWQISHCQVDTDNFGNIKPHKRSHSDYRTIDGIQAGVMALSRALVVPPKRATGSLFLMA